MTLQKDGHTDGWTDGWPDGRGYNNIPAFSLKSAGIKMDVFLISTKKTNNIIIMLWALIRSTSVNAHNKCFHEEIRQIFFLDTLLI